MTNQKETDRERAAREAYEAKMAKLYTNRGKD